SIGVFAYIIAAAALRCFFSSYFSLDVIILTLSYLLILTEYVFYCTYNCTNRMIGMLPMGRKYYLYFSGGKGVLPII
ncbi:hypothetical protein, partial [Chamaesiphon sp. VAR_48_metabat_403]|uniref:hypothetical protein n=1 Tax=Chamaesiphon sp. VAR_48_metabat_403 TaxID=2964700 RepID=UPI00286E076A